MSDRIHVTMALDLFVEDDQALRQAAFERLQSAWSSEDDFPYESASDVPLDQAVHSVLADALPADLPGCRRSRLEIEVEGGSADKDAEQEAESDEGSSESEGSEVGTEESEESEEPTDDKSEDDDSEDDDSEEGDGKEDR